MKNGKISAVLAFLLACGCSEGDGSTAGGGGSAVGGSGGSSGTAGSGASGASVGNGASTSTGGMGTASCESGDPFAGPELRDCDLPGACGRCLWEKACPQFLYQCAHDADCVCMAECVGTLGVGGTDSCLGQCGLTGSPPGFSEWVKLAADMCWDEGCGRLTEPPPEPLAPASSGSIGAGTDESCFLDPSLPFDPCGPVLQLESTDGNICVRIDRRDDGPGNDANTTWTLLDVRIGPLGEVCHTDAPGDLCWYSSHHNFADWAHVTCGDRHYDINVANNCGTENRNPSPTFQLHVSESQAGNGTCAPTVDGICPIGTPIELLPVP